jgi:uncharacterized protein with HEPN domain
MSGVKNYSSLMLLHCGKILTKIEGLTHRDWVLDENLRDAVCMRLLSLTECVKEYIRENPAILNEHPDIPWDNIVRFRDKIAHHYEGMDYDVVWGILESDIQPLYEVINKLNRSGGEGD